MLLIYLLIVYIAGIYTLRTIYIEEGGVTIGDALMFILAPFSFVPVLFSYILSHIVDLDDFLFTRKDK